MFSSSLDSPFALIATIKGKFQSLGDYFAPASPNFYSAPWQGGGAIGCLVLFPVHILDGSTLLAHTYVPVQIQ